MATHHVRNEAIPAYHIDPLPTDDLIERAKAILLAELRARRVPDVVITSPPAVKDYLQLHLAARPHEVFCVLFLDSKHRLLVCEEMFRGTLDGASVYPREVAKRALELNAAAVILAHNHPSGDPDPSEADRKITQRLKEALALVDVRTLDHIVVGETVVSFAERGLL